MSERSITRRLGLSAVIAAFGLATLGIAGVVPVLANPLQSPSMKLAVDFPRTVGLYKDSRVLVQGVAAGKVEKLEPAADRVSVTLSVHDVNLDPNATATLRLRSLIGERFVELSPVWSGQGPKMQSGTRIPMARTRVPAEVNQFTDETARVARELDAKALGDMVHELGQALGGGGNSPLAGATNGLSQLGQTVAAQAQGLDDSITQLQRVIGTLAEKDDQVSRILRDSTAISQALLAQQGAMDGAISGVDKMLGTLTDFTSKEKDKIAATVHLLSTTGKQLAAHEAGWQRILDITPYYAYGWYNAIHHDGNQYFMMEQISGIMFLPYPHQLNEQGGPGARGGDDHTVYPSVDFSCSPARAVIPWQVDTTKVVGAGPLIPDQNIGNGRIIVDNTPNNSEKEPGYEGGTPQTAPPPNPSGCPNTEHTVP
jgi:phospholipid/cholesterol/gamma-HCH transport system substrate-binding protein